MMDGSTLFEMEGSPPTLEDRPLIVDSFAGGGGASTGIEMALGRSPDIAINHNPAALALHAANHPDTLHLSENVYRIDPLDHLADRHIGLMWFSPDCKHFSKAKGGKPVARNIRDLAWIIPGWIERIQKSGGRVDVVMMENVEEFATWGPLIETPKGLMPCPDRRGETFTAWRKAIKRLGGKIEQRELRGCDYGAPTIRKRLFVIIRFDGLPIVWPQPSHGDPASPEVVSGKLQPWRTAAECIDWSLPCPSIFDSKAEIMEKHALRAVRPLADNTLARVARGLSKYVVNAANPFLVSIAHGYSGGRREYPMDAPFGVVTATAIGHAIVSPSIVKFTTGGTGHAVSAPLATVTANSWIKKPGGAAPLGLLAPSLMSMKGTARRDSAITAPHPTVLAGGGHSALISPVLTYAQHGGQVRDIDAPHHTITASFKDQNAVIVPTLVQTGYGERKGQAPRSLDVAAPLGTIVAGGVKHAPVAAYLAQHNTGVVGRRADTPLSSVTAAGSQQNPVAAYFAKYYGTGDGARTDEPMHTITVKDRIGHLQAQLAAPPFSAEHEAKARKVANLLREHDLWDQREFVTLEIEGETYVVVDVGMRMLTPRELFTAQGFPTDYVIEGVWDENGGDWTFKAFSKDVQISCVGNSVCPQVAKALAEANTQHLIKREAAA